MRCSGGTLAACPWSSELVFVLSGKPGTGFLSAYAEPVGHDDERVFYFSKEDGSAELVVPAEGERVSERAVRLPAGQGPGSYRVHAVLADRPLSRDELLEGSGQRGGADLRAKARVELVVTPP